MEWGLYRCNYGKEKTEVRYRVSPQPGWQKLNMDASVRGTLGNAAIGGVLQGENGQWAWGFCCQKLVNGAKLKALAFGLERAWEQLIEKLTVETDLNNVFRYLNVDIDDSHPYCQTIVQCRILIHKPWTSHAKCVPREVNSVADCLAKFGHDYGGRKHNLFGSSLGGSVSVCVIFLGFCLF